jgi:hypothetical protein
MNEPALEPGSFRDRSARVFYRNGEVFRGLTEGAFEDWQTLASTSFYRRFTENGSLIPTQQVDSSTAAAVASPVRWAAVLKHQRVPFVSYPYEWSFGMLKDAALLQLDLLLAALDEGMTIKDGSAYNVQWLGRSPVFVDVGSFQKLAPGQPWIGYRQFCQLFLYPLLIQAYRDVPFQPLLRGSLEGIDAEVCWKLLGVRDLHKGGVLTHVYLQARAQAACAGTARDVRQDLRSAGFDVSLIKANASKLRALVAGLIWKPARSTWSEYAACGHYEDADTARKIAFVRGVADARRWKLVWDLGCNIGRYSRIVAERAQSVVAIDADHLTIDRLYERLKSEPVPNILPLVGNLADPSPDLGWRNRERTRIAARGRPDLVLGLALVHHLVIGANLPLVEVLDWLRELEADLVIEFVTRDDPMVGILLRNKDDQYADYDVGLFERELAARFTVVERQPLDSGTRILYYGKPLST